MSGYFSPGRIEVFGKHTDYAGGRVLVCAVDRGVTAVVTPGTEGIVARSSAATDVVHLTVGQDAKLPRGHWGRYVQVGVNRLGLNFGPLEPVTIEFDSDLPLASGMSSSSALVVACMMALARHNGFDQTDEWRANIQSDLDLAVYLASAEMGGTFRRLEGLTGVGTQGGSEDHTAMLCSEAGKLGMFSFDPPTELGKVDFPDDYAFVVAVSGVAAEKTGAALELYNRASWGVREVVRLYNEANGTDFAKLAALVDAVEPERIYAALNEDPYLTGRLRQFIAESTELVPGAFDALSRGDLDGFAGFAARSFEQAAIGLDNQIPETHALVASALELGAKASSAFGAGFGGSVWALVARADADAFADAWLARYRADYPVAGVLASTMVTRPADGAHPLD